LGAGSRGGVNDGKMTAVGFEPTPLRNGALSHRLRPLGQTVLRNSDETHLYAHALVKRNFPE
jgi:hypothetical protein